MPKGLYTMVFLRLSKRGSWWKAERGEGFAGSGCTAVVTGVGFKAEALALLAMSLSVLLRMFVQAGEPKALPGFGLCLAQGTLSCGLRGFIEVQASKDSACWRYGVWGCRVWEKLGKAGAVAVSFWSAQP